MEKKYYFILYFITWFILIFNIWFVNADYKVVGGVIEKGYPETVIVENGGKCTGVLIDDGVFPLESSKVVLTAAHCGDATGIKIEALDNKTYSYGVKYNLYHPLWKGKLSSYDISVLILNNAVNILGVIPAPLASKDILYEHGYRFVGYGGTGNLEEAGKRRSFPAYINGISENTFSILSEEGNEAGNVCYGDSGGPLYKEETKEVFGIASRGDACEIGGTEAIFSNVWRHRDFINGVIESCVRNDCSPPVFPSFNRQMIKAEEWFNFTIKANYFGLKSLNYFVYYLPLGAKFYYDTNTLSWKPSITQIREHTVIFKVSDGLLTDFVFVNFFVYNGSKYHPPIIEGNYSYTIEINSNLSFKINAKDPDNDSLVYTINQNADNAIVDPFTGIFRWKPKQIGYYEFTAFVSDLFFNIEVPIKIKVVPKGRVPFIRGDANMDRRVDISDPAYILNALFKNDPVNYPIKCQDSADANDDGKIDLADAIYLNSYLFNKGPKPKMPFPTPGIDPSADGLGCGKGL